MATQPKIQLPSFGITHEATHIMDNSNPQISEFSNSIGKALQTLIQQTVDKLDRVDNTENMEGLVNKIADVVERRIDTIDIGTVRQIAEEASHSEDQIRQMATDEIDNYDLDDMLDSALSTTDFTTYVEDALDTYDFEHKVEEAVSSSTSPIATVSELKAIEDRQHEILNALQKMGEAISSISPIQI